MARELTPDVLLVEISLPDANGLEIARTVKSTCPTTHIVVLGDKDSEAIGRLLRPLVDRWIVCTVHEPRGLPAEELARRMKAGAALSDAQVQLAASTEEGFAAAKALAVPGDRVVVCGGFNIVGSAMRWLQI